MISSIATRCASLLVVLWLVMATLASAQVGLPIAEPEDVGMSSERLARIGPAMQAYIDRGEVAGTVTLVARRGRIVWVDARGYADREAGTPLEVDSLFRLASQTKPVTAVAAMILLEQGRFRLDDPIAKYLPEYADMKVAVVGDSGEVELVPAERPITIRHLLTHTAGLSEGVNPKVRQKQVEMYQAFEWPADDTLANVVTKYTKLALGFQPGTAWQYSPIAGINVVARLVEVLSGQTLADFDREHIFEPLGMQDTFYYVPLDKLDRYTVGYRRRPDGSIYPADPADGRSRFVREGLPKKLFPGAGGLVSTVDDYLRFAQMLLEGGELDGVRILGRKTVELMTSPHTGDIPTFGPLALKGSRFGLGVSVTVDRTAAGALGSTGTYGWGGAFGTTFWIDPEEELIGLYMMQLGRHQALRIRSEFRTLVYAAIVD
jgi:CubicO group peptidase (beta-lactamase class C family)